MKTLRFIAPLACMSVMLAAAPLAHADSTVYGSVYEGGTTYSVPAYGSSIYSTTPTVSIAVSNSNPANVFSFYSANDSSLSGFLTAGGSTVTGLGTHAGDGINNDLFRFTGTTYLTAGETLSITDDDGVNLYLDGSSTCVICSPNPQSAGGPHTYTVGAAGTYSFTLDYAEVAGPPAELDASLGAIAPEPSSFVLLGSGLLAAAGVVRRRLFV